MIPLTHSDLVARAARWLRNTQGCDAVFTEMNTYSGEIPDAIGWKRSGRSLLIECKAYRGDFLADSEKEFRRNPLVALGSERYYLAPPNTIGINEVPEDWGLLELRGNGIRVVKPARPRKDLRSDLAVKYELMFLIQMLNRVQIRIDPISVDQWLKYENKAVSDPKTLMCDSDTALDIMAASKGLKRVVDPSELPTIHEATEDPWCPKHEAAFESCPCIPPNDPAYHYEYIGDTLYARPLAQP
jgi:hypothetical protein